MYATLNGAFLGPENFCFAGLHCTEWKFSEWRSDKKKKKKKKKIKKKKLKSANKV